MNVSDLDRAGNLIAYRNQLIDMRTYLQTATGVVAISTLEPNLTNGRFVVNAPVIAVKVATIGPGLLNIVSGQLSNNDDALTALGIGLIAATDIPPTGIPPT